MPKYFLLWFPMILIAVLNGAARDLWYKQYVGELLGHQISTITLILLFSIYVWFVIKRFTPASSKISIYIGILWLVLTLIFEFGIGFYQGHSMEHLLNDYNILKGRIWVLIPIWVLIAPSIFYKFKFKSP